MNRLTRVATAGVLLATSLGLGGCLVSGSSRETMSGQYVGPSTFEQIQPGRTTESWVAGALGEPTSKTCLDDGSSLWKWSFRRSKSSNSAVFLVFGGSSRKETEGATYVQIKDGVVVKAWQD